MVAVADFSRLVSSIYEAAVTPQHWELAIRDIQCALGGTGGALLQGEGSVWSFHDYTIPAAAMQSYTDHYHRSDYVLAAMRTADVGLAQTDRKSLSRTAIRSSTRTGCGPTNSRTGCSSAHRRAATHLLRHRVVEGRL